MKTFRYLLILPFCLISFDTIAVALSAHRLYIDQKTPTTSMYLFNSSGQDVVCTLSIVNSQITSEGNITKGLDNSDKNSAAKLVRFSPRRIEISGQSSQKINFVYRRRPNIEDGEYRGLFAIACKEEQSQNSEFEEQIKLTPKLVQQIPLILRTRNINLSGELGVLDTGDALTIDISTEGARSVTGDLLLVNKETGEVVSSVKKLTIYNEVPSKRYTLNKRGVENDQLVVEFKELPQFGGDLHLSKTL